MQQAYSAAKQARPGSATRELEEVCTVPIASENGLEHVSFGLLSFGLLSPLGVQLVDRLFFRIPIVSRTRTDSPHLCLSTHARAQWARSGNFGLSRQLQDVPGNSTHNFGSFGSLFCQTGSKAIVCVVSRHIKVIIMSLSPIDMKQVIPLVTGGGSGIGLGLVREFLKRGSPKVLITGRRLDVLQGVAAEFPAGKLFFKVSDAGNPADRVALLNWVEAEHDDCNALVNNAGVQRAFPLANDTGSWEERVSEIEINMHGPIHLCSLFTPFFLKKDTAIALLANVSSGLAFVPYMNGPVYSATKAAIHSYTMGLRYSLQDTHVRVVEIVPPAVKTNLGGSHAFGEDLDEYVAATMDRVQAGEPEVGFKFSETARLADRATLDGMMNQLATSMHVAKYPAK
jgi:uncharacterized oxidoreductase